MRGIAILWAVAVAALAIAWFAPMGTPAAVVQPEAVSGQPTFTLPALPQIAALPETTARPLFNTTRRAAPAAPARQAPAANEPAAAMLGRYKLSGVVIDGKTRKVLVAPATGGKIVSVSEGDMLDGWKVERISPESLTLRAGDRTETVELRAPPRNPRN